jgi:hypothetical protein
MTAQPRDDARIDERGRCSPRSRDHPRSGRVQFVPTLTSFSRRAGMLRQASAGIGFPRAVRGPAAAPWATTLRGRLAFVRLGPSGRVSPPSSPSVPSRELPGFGAPALPSALDLESLALALPVAEVAVAILPAPPRHQAGEPSAELWSSLPVQST